MINKKLFAPLFIAAIVVAISIHPGAMVFAESEDGGVSAGANLDIQTRTSTNDREGTRIEATTSLGSDKSDSSETDNEDSHAPTTPKTVHGENSDRSLSQQDQQGDNGNSDTSDEIDVDHQGALDATNTLENSDQVHNRGQLRSFLNHIVKADDRVTGVQVSSTTVLTHYALPAKFMWAIPASISAQVSVGADGSVTITYPWYAFLYSKQDDALKNQLVQAASSTTGGSASTTFSASQQAHLLNEILTALKGD
jgi:hypothetical protein